MNKLKIIVVSAATVGLGAAGVTAAFASSPSPKPPAVTSTPAGATTDGDTLQEGDQTTPDVPGAVDAAEAPETAGSETAEEVGPALVETADTGTEANESATAESGPSDGNDGGHEDPAGADVNHVGGPNEK